MIVDQTGQIRRLDFPAVGGGGSLRREDDRHRFGQIVDVEDRRIVGGAHHRAINRSSEGEPTAVARGSAALARSMPFLKEG